jgi:hypothetical protein
VRVAGGDGGDDAAEHPVGDRRVEADGHLALPAATQALLEHGQQERRGRRSCQLDLVGVGDHRRVHVGDRLGEHLDGATERRGERGPVELEREVVTDVAHCAEG